MAPPLPSRSRPPMRISRDFGLKGEPLGIGIRRGRRGSAAGCGPLPLGHEERNLLAWGAGWRASVAAPYNQGYHDLGNLRLRAINGRHAGGVRDALEAFRHPEGDLHRLEFCPNGTATEMVLDAELFCVASEAILQAYEIPLGVRLREAPLPPLGDACERGA